MEQHISLRTISEKLDQLIKSVHKIVHASEKKVILPQDKEILSSEEAADFLCLSITTLNKYTSAGKIPYSKPCGPKHRVFLTEELRKWVRNGRKQTIDEVYQNPTKSHWEAPSPKVQSNFKPSSKEYLLFLAVTKGKSELGLWESRNIPVRN